MRILFISDIHGITTNLDKIKDIYNKGNFDKMVVLGDLYYAGFNGNSYLDYYATVPSLRPYLNRPA